MAPARDGVSRGREFERSCSDYVNMSANHMCSIGSPEEQRSRSLAGRDEKSEAAVGRIPAPARDGVSRRESLSVFKS